RDGDRARDGCRARRHEQRAPARLGVGGEGPLTGAWRVDPAALAGILASSLAIGCGGDDGRSPATPSSSTTANPSSGAEPPDTTSSTSMLDPQTTSGGTETTGTTSRPGTTTT